MKKTICMDHIKTHYCSSHHLIHNTYGIIPVYDVPDLEVANERENILVKARRVDREDESKKRNTRSLPNS